MEKTKESLVKVIRTQPSVSIYWLPIVLGSKGFRVTKGKSVTKKA